MGSARNAFNADAYVCRSSVVHTAKAEMTVHRRQHGVGSLHRVASLKFSILSRPLRCLDGTTSDPKFMDRLRQISLGHPG
jgi:hypothetical protein